MTWNSETTKLIRHILRSEELQASIRTRDETAIKRLFAILRQDVIEGHADRQTRELVVDIGDFGRINWKEIKESFR